MCTLTALPLAGGGYRLAFNRDESRRRPAGLGPRRVQAGRRRAVMPIDPVSMGSWIGVNDAGLTAGLLNRYAGPPASGARPAAARASRGVIVPAVLGAGTLEEAAALAGELDPSGFPPFRLALCDGRACLELISDGLTLRRGEALPLAEPVMLTSSGLGDHRVEGPRRELFRAMLLFPGAGLEEQDAFHRHCWPDRPELSVCMRRPEAATVSLTIVEVDRRAGEGRLIHHPGPPDEPAARSTVSLDLPA